MLIGKMTHFMKTLGIMCYKNYRRWEILDFMRRDYSQYAWSLGTLSRRMHFFKIYVSIDEVENAVQEEMDGLGQLLGYRPLHKKICEDHGLAVHVSVKIMDLQYMDLQRAGV